MQRSERTQGLWYTELPVMQHSERATQGQRYTEPPVLQPTQTSNPNQSTSNPEMSRNEIANARLNYFQIPTHECPNEVQILHDIDERNHQTEADKSRERKSKYD